MNMKVAALVLALVVVFPLTSAAQTGDRVILIPTLYTGPGAHGSNWWSSIVINNYSAQDYRAPGVLFAISCAIPEGCFGDHIPAGSYGGLVSPGPANGLLLYATADVAPRLAFQARFGSGIFYLSNGTELPIVRDDRFRRDAIHFPMVNLHLTHVPVRSTLRIYGVDAQTGTKVRVEVRHWDTPSGAPKLAKEFELDVPASPAFDRPIFPAFTQLQLQNEFPFPELLGSSFNVSVVPLPLPSGEIPRVWAFITAVENATHVVTVQQPQ